MNYLKDFIKEAASPYRIWILVQIVDINCEGGDTVCKVIQHIEIFFF